MKNKITLILSALIMSINFLMAQSPDMINYQGVAHNLNGTPIANQNIKVRLKIRNNTNVGAVKYSEVRSVTTDASGLFNIQIGSPGALSTTGSWASIVWESGPKFLQVEMDPTGGTNFINMGTQQLISVPYAQHANQASALAPGSFLPFSQLDTTGAKYGSVNTLFFDGTSYVPSNLLPYNVSDPNLVSFAITNTSAVGGQAIYGMNTVNNANATGVRGECNKANGRGVYGKAIGASAYGVYGENTTGVAIKGKATSASGIGVVGESTSYDGINGITSSSTSGVAGVRGVNNGTNGRGVVGAANAASSYGVEGTSTNGTGVFGYSNSNIGVYGSCITGTALKGYSNSGYGLDVTGKVKISGGNTAPGAGKVLTSDASGNATWQSPIPKIAFRAGKSNTNFPYNQSTLVDWTNVIYNFSNAFDSTTNEFTAPVSGVYVFESATQVEIQSPSYNITESSISIVKLQGPYPTTLAEVNGPIFNGALNSYTNLHITTEVRLQAGDRIAVQVRQYNFNNLTATSYYGGYPELHFFSGHLVFAE